MLMIPFTKKIAVMLKLNCRMEDILDEHQDSMRFPNGAAEASQKACFSMFHLQHGLQMHFRDLGNRKRFNMTSKCHFLCHIDGNSSNLSPRKTWCFQGEDQMRRVQRLAQSCLRRPYGCNHQNGEAFQIGHAFLLEQMLKNWPLSREG